MSSYDDDDGEELVLAVLTGHLSHTASLDLHSPKTADDLEYILHATTSPAPSLHTLTLSIPYYAPGAPLSVSNEFMGGVAPLLKRLSLKACNLPWDSPLLQGLTHCELVIPLPLAGNLPLPKFARMLERCPDLEFLRIWRYLSIGNGSVPESVELPRLRSLEILSQMPILLQLMSKVKVSNSARINLGIEAGNASPDDVSRLLALSLPLSEDGKSGRKNPITVPSLQWSGGEGGFTGLFLNCWDIFPVQDIQDQPSFTLTRFFAEGTSVDCEENTHAMLKALSLSSVQALQLHNMSISSRTVEQFLSSLPNVVYFRLFTSETATPFIEMLGRSLGASEDRTIFLPRLNELILGKVVFGPAGPGIELKDLLIEKLFLRRDRGVGPKSLVFMGCQGLLKEDIVKLRMFIPHVVVEN
ncbi:hypothetical protein V5O48_009308 [Marasmius crinis-equi]|uniref:Uncharacterized protein n=1 Tax=Marasmius crinis-equi TaxID=585013 RepID=A0ABR3FBM2_9AGAR